jgi:hypothetical protein
MMESGASRKIGILVRVPQGPVDFSGVKDDGAGVSLDGL